MNNIFTAFTRPRFTDIRPLIISHLVNSPPHFRKEWYLKISTVENKNKKEKRLFQITTAIYCDHILNLKIRIGREFLRGYITIFCFPILFVNDLSAREWSIHIWSNFIFDSKEAMAAELVLLLFTIAISINPRPVFICYHLTTEL